MKSVRIDKCVRAVAIALVAAVAFPVAASASERAPRLGHGPPIITFNSVLPPDDTIDCIRSPRNPTAAYRLEDLREYIAWRFREEYDPWYRNDGDGGVIESPEKRFPGIQYWSRVWLGGHYEAASEVYEFPTGADIVRFDTMQTWFAKDHTDVPVDDVPRFIDEHAQIVCNGNFVLFLMRWDHLGEKEKREVDFFVRFFREFSPTVHQSMKTTRREVEEWTQWLGGSVRVDKFEEALTRLEDYSSPPAGEPELYAELKQAENQIDAEIARLQWMRGLAHGQLLRLTRLRDVNDLLAWREYDRIVAVGDFATLRQLYDLSKAGGNDTPLLRTAAARLMIRLPGEHFERVPIEFVGEYERAITAASKNGELDQLWKNFGVAERVSVHEIRRFHDYAAVELRFSKDLGLASYTAGGAWVLLDRSDLTCGVCVVLDTWTY